MSILAKILATKEREIALAKVERSIEDLQQQAETRPPPRSLSAALRRPEAEPVRVIAEIKRASPSAGAIRPEADPADIARQYADAGAAAISVLTDREYFDGDLAFLDRVHPVVALPLLRKDFLIDPYQIVEARAAGADAVLLIVAALDDATLVQLLALAGRWGMDALVETHDEAEAHRAVAAGAGIIGINHRNLATFEMDMTLTDRLRPSIPANTILVGESGIRSADDVRSLGAAGVDAVLVGEQLMRAARPGDALRSLLGYPQVGG